MNFHLFILYSPIEKNCSQFFVVNESLACFLKINSLSNKKGNRKIDLVADKAPKKFEIFISRRRGYGLFPSPQGNF